MAYTEKIDVLDMIIQVLLEHEKTLDHLITRLEGAVSRFAPKTGV